MKKLIYTGILSGLAALAVSCWTEDIPEAGAARHQVEALTATPGDEEVALAWEIPDGWNPTDYIVFYTDEQSQTVTLRTGGANRYVVDKLTNGVSYNFNVQAVYGKLISNAVTVAGTPSTSRLPVTDLTVTDTGDGYVEFAWSAPSNLVVKYTLSYYIEDKPGDIRTAEIGRDATSYRCEGLTNDKNYIFSLAAEYEKGPAEADVVRAMPTVAIPYFLSTETAAVDQPVTFEFNREAYPDAAEVKWTFPDDAVLTGDKVLSGFKATGSQTVVLTAKIGESQREWKITIAVRDYVVNYNDWVNNGKYESPTYTCPVLAPDAGTVYVNTGINTSNLYAFDVSTGALRWTFSPEEQGDARSSSKSMVTVNPVTGVVYYGSEIAGQFYAVNPDGTRKWTFTGAGSMNSAPPAVSADGGTVYLVDGAGRLFALDAETGAAKWAQPYESGNPGYGLLVNGDDVVVGCSKAVHFVRAADGQAIARVDGVTILNYTGFAVSPDGRKAYFSNTTSLAAVDLTTRQLVHSQPKQNLGNFYQPIVGSDGTVFAGTKEGWVAFYSADLQTLVYKEQPSERKSSTFNFSRPCVDAQNRFYIVAAGNSSKGFASLVLVYNSNGTLNESWDYTQNNAQNGCNLADGVLYTVNQGSSSDGNGLLIGRYIGAERGRGWSSHGGDHCGTGCIQSPLIEW